MLNEVTPSLLTRLASVKLTLKGMLAEVEAIELEISALGGTAGDWLPADRAAALLGLRSERQLLAWAREAGLSHKLVGKVRFFKASEITAAIERGETRTGAPPQKQPKRAPVDTAAATFDNLFKMKGAKRHGS